MVDSEIDVDSRREIYQTIRDTPGVHFRELCRRLDYAQGTLQYHIRWLRNHDLLEAESDGEYTRYYTAEDFSSNDKTVLNALRRKYSREIIAYLATEDSLTTTELAERVEKSPSTVSWHLSHLHEAGLVEKERHGRAVVYSLTDPDRILTLYTVHEASFTNQLLDALLDIWE